MKKLTLIITLLSLAICTSYSQNIKIELNPDKDGKAALVEIKEDSLITVYIDGKKYDSDILDILDPDKIKSINVIKGEKAIELYDSPRVIEISTKASSTNYIIESTRAIKIRSNDNLIEINEKSFGDPLIVIDGEITTKDKFKSLKPDDINSVSVLKDKSATILYGSKGENGVVIVETKSYKKSKKKD